MTEKSRTASLYQVLDFGLTPEELAERALRPRLTEAQIAVMIVSEEELQRLGRWAGLPQPARRGRY